MTANRRIAILAALLCALAAGQSLADGPVVRQAPRPIQPVDNMARSPLAPVVRREEPQAELPRVVEPQEYTPSMGRSSVCHHQAAGWPKQIAPWAKVGYGPKYKAYYVGGGAVPGRHSIGRPLRTHEGTFGVDYNPWYSRVALFNSVGALFQGGTGQYEPDHRNTPFHLSRRPAGE